MHIDSQRTLAPKPHPGPPLGFGVHFTDHLFKVEWEQGKGWQHPRIEPYAPLQLDPAAGGLQYGQSIFEGMKAFRQPGGPARLFRPLDHCRRLNASAQRLCMPEVPNELLLEGVKALVKIDLDWIPTAPSTSLYLRPTLIGTEGFLGVRPASRYLLYVIASPVGAYWKDGFKPLKIWVEEKYARAVQGGIGAAKAGGNYAASLLAAEEAKKKGYSQVLWLDGAEKKYLEEIGTMNLFLRTKDGLVTPPLDGGSLLAGVTRKSVLDLAREWGVKAEERTVSVDELAAWHASGNLLEAFGTGTAAVIAPIGEFGWASGKKLVFGDGQPGEFTKKVLAAIEGIQTSRAPDTHKWLMEV